MNTPVFVLGVLLLLRIVIDYLETHAVRVRYSSRNFPKRIR